MAARRDGRYGAGRGEGVHKLESNCCFFFAPFTLRNDIACYKLPTLLYSSWPCGHSGRGHIYVRNNM